MNCPRRPFWSPFLFFVFVFCFLAGICVRWHPRIRIGLLASPLCGAAVTFVAAAKKVTKESGFKPPVPARTTLRHTFFELSRSDATLRRKPAVKRAQRER
ncbi:hypothetical protein PSAB6_30211 [Paraburkholderia sabiae]|nr:hypothetical protein PSAB6_30211 [Paraburkholderia sabiae]